MKISRKLRILESLKGDESVFDVGKRSRSPPEAGNVGVVCGLAS